MADFSFFSPDFLLTDEEKKKKNPSQVAAEQNKSTATENSTYFAPDFLAKQTTPLAPVQAPIPAPAQPNLIQQAANALGNLFKPKTQPNVPQNLPNVNPDIFKQQAQSGASATITPVQPKNVFDSTYSGSQWMQAPVMSPIDKVVNYFKVGVFNQAPFKDDAQIKADAQVTYALQQSIAKKYNIPKDQIQQQVPILDVQRNKEKIIDELGLKLGPSNSDIVGAMIMLPVMGAFIEAPVIAAVGMGAFQAMSEVESGLVSLIKGEQYKPLQNKGLVELLPPDTSDEVKAVVGLLDLIAKAKALHVAYKSAPKYMEKFTTQLTTTYNIPKTVTIDAAKVRSIFTTGEAITTQEMDLIKSLGLTSSQYKAAAKNGITIEVPWQKVATITDRPWYAKIRSLIGLPENVPKMTTATYGKVTRGVAGALPPGEPPFPATNEVIMTPDQVREQIKISDLNQTQAGDTLLKLADEAASSGKSLQFFVGGPSPTATITTPGGVGLKIEQVEPVNNLKPAQNEQLGGSTASQLGTQQAQAGITADNKVGVTNNDNIGSLYSEQSPQSAKAILGIRGGNEAPLGIYAANSPELAIGQGSNKGVKIEFDQTKVKVSPTTNQKPAAGFMAQQRLTDELKINSISSGGIKSVELSPSILDKENGIFRTELAANGLDVKNPIQLPNGNLKFVSQPQVGPATNNNNLELYNGSNKTVTKETKSFGRVLVEDVNQATLIKKLADEGNARARNLYNISPDKAKVDFVTADSIIKAAYKGQYDAIQYNNNTPALKASGVTYYDLSTGKSWAVQEATAKVYAMQNRSGKYGEPVTKEDQLAMIQDNENQLKDIYSNGANEDKFYEALSKAYTELQLSEAGYRYQKGDMGEFAGVQSTFPDWVEDSLRSKALFDKVLPQLTTIEDLKYPDGNKSRERALFDEVLDEIDKEVGVDTSKIRSAILKTYDLPISTETKKLPTGGTTVSQKGATTTPEGPKLSPEDQAIQDYIDKRTVKFRTAAPSIPDNLLPLAEEAKKYNSAEEFVKSFDLYHGTPNELEGGVLKFGAGKQLKKGGYMGGHFLTNERDIAQGFSFGGKVYRASGDIKNKVLDVNANKNLFEDFIGKEYKDIDGEMMTFTKQHFDYMFPNGEADWSTINQDLTEYLARKAGKIGISIPEYAVGKRGTTYQLFEDKIPVYTDQQLTDLYYQATGADRGSVKDLVALHNLSVSKLENAARIGGLAMPSLAITKKDYPISGYGDITLVGDRNMVDPQLDKTSKVFNADIYSPRYPSITYTHTTYQPVKDAIAGVDKYFTDKDVKSYLYQSEYGIMGDFDSKGIESLRYSYKIKASFAASKGISKDASYEDIYDFANKNSNEYQKYLDSIYNKLGVTEKIFKGFTYSGNRRYALHTLENAVKDMKASPLQGGENFVYGAPSIRAVVAKPLKSIEKIKAESDKIISPIEMEKLKEGFSDEFSNLLDKHNIEDISNFTNILIDNLRGLTKNSELQDYPATKGVDMTDFYNFAEKLRNAPTEYFEAKLKRAVPLSDFSAAILPEKYRGTSTVDLLKKNGIDRIEFVKDNATQEEISKVIDEKLPDIKFRVKDDFQKATGAAITDAQEQQIIDLNKKIFGDDNVAITLQIYANQKALGSYQGGIIKILDGQVAPKDTYYHEAVHKYLDAFTTRDEQLQLFKEARAKFGITDLAQVEEKIAEDFISYAKTHEGFVGKIKELFDKIIQRIRQYFGNQSEITKLYDDIISGKAKEVPGSELKPEQLPVGEGKVRGSTAFSRIVERYGQEMADLKVDYNRLNLEHDVELSMEYINNNPNEALQVAFGLKAPPVGQTETAISISLADKVLQIGNVQLWKQLEASRSLRQTRRGQEVVAERGRFDDNSPHAFLAKIIDKKMDLLGEKVKGGVTKELEAELGRKPTNKEAAVRHIDNEAQKLQKEMTKERAKINSKLNRAQAIIDALRCK